MSLIDNWVNTREKNVDWSQELTEENHDEMEMVLWDRFNALMPQDVLADDVCGVCIYFVGREPVGFYDYENGVGHVA
jgi:hypothetical protein